MSNKPKVDDPGTISYWSDCEACTVIAVSPSGKTVTVRVDKSIVTNKPKGYGDTVEYRYERDPDGREMTFRVNKNGDLSAKGGKGPYLGVGSRRKYRDPHF
jgi:hypothetical protein